jgi:integrase
MSEETTHSIQSRRKTWAGSFLTDQERDLLLALVPDPTPTSSYARRIQGRRDRAILAVFVFAGLRRNELRLLDRRDIQLNRNRVHVRHGKGGKERYVPLHPIAQEAIRDYLAERIDPDPALFLTNRRKRISNRTLCDVLHRYLPGLDTGEERVTLHALRRTFATVLYQRTRDPVTVQRLLGHANLQTTMLYIGLVDDELRDAVNQL